MAIPLKSQVSERQTLLPMKFIREQLSLFIGNILCMCVRNKYSINSVERALSIVCVSVYYNNIWESKNFPFVRAGTLFARHRTECNL